MPQTVGWILAVVGLGVGFSLPAQAASTPNYKLAERCADASGFTARAIRHPDYKRSKVYATPQELAYINRCVDGTSGKARGQTRAVRGTLPLPRQYPLMSGDAALWSRMTMPQQRRALSFLKTGSTIQSSLMGD